MKRISIASLLGFVAVVAFGFAAMVNATDFWAGLTYTLMIGTLFAGLLGVVMRGRRGGAWMGCLIFGWGYLLLGYCIEAQQISYNLDLMGNHFALVDSITEWVFTKSNSMPQVEGNTIAVNDVGRVWTWRLRNAERIGHYLFVILFAQVGALLGRYLSRRPEPVFSSPTEAPSN